MLVPNVKAMSQAIETHIAKCHQKVKDPEEGERVRDDLITQVLKIASES